MLVPGGTLVCAGAAKTGGWLGILARLLAMIVRSCVLRQRVVFYVAKLRREDLAYLKELIEAGRLRTVIDKHYSLNEIAEAHRHAEGGHKKGHVVVVLR